MRQRAAAALALLLALLIASFGAQTLYPREGVVGMWAAIGVAMRVSVERAAQAMGRRNGARLDEAGAHGRIYRYRVCRIREGCPRRSVNQKSEIKSEPK